MVLWNDRIKWRWKSEPIKCADLNFSFAFAGKASVTGISGSTTTGTANFADGIGTNAQFISPLALTIDSSMNLFVVDSATSIRKVAPTGGSCFTDDPHMLIILVQVK